MNRSKIYNFIGLAVAGVLTACSGAANTSQDSQSTAVNPLLNYTFHLEARDGNCLDLFASPPAFDKCVWMKYPDRNTAGDDFTFLAPGITGDHFRAQLLSQKNLKCLTAVGGNLSLAPCGPANDSTQQWDLRFSKTGELDEVSIGTDRWCLEEGENRQLKTGACDPRKSRQGFSMRRVFNACPHEDADGAANLAVFPPIPYTDSTSLIWGDCLNSGILLRSRGFDPDSPTHAEALALATTAVQPAVIATDDIDRIFWGDMSGHLYVYHLSTGKAEILEQYGPHHGSPEIGKGRPHFLVYRKSGSRESLILVDQGTMLTRDLSLPFNPSTSALTKLERPVEGEPLDGNLHSGVVSGVPVVDKEGDLFVLGGGRIRSKLWINLEGNGRWSHRYLGAIGGATTRCRDITYNEFTDSLYALCNDGVWKVKKQRGGGVTIFRLVRSEEIGGENQKSAHVFGDDDRIFVFEEDCRCVRQLVRSGAEGYVRGPDILSGAINNVWETAVFMRPSDH